MSIHQQLSAKIHQFRIDALAAARQAPTVADKRAAFGLEVLAETLRSIAAQLQELLPPRDLEGEAAVAKLFRGWTEADLRKQQIRKLRRSRARSFSCGPFSSAK